MRRDILMVLLIAGIAGVLYFYKKDGIPGILPVTPSTTPKETPAKPEPTLSELLGGFSATVAELEALAEIVGRDSSTYKAAIDEAFYQAKEQLGPGKVVGWTMEKGYHILSEEEARSYYH